jgi:hypothetical protein
MKTKRGYRAFVGAVVVASSLMLSGCQAPAPAPHDGEEPSHIEHIDGTDLTRVTITEKAAERIDLQTTEVFARVMPRSSSPVTCVPYSALIYTPEGATWIYISDEPRSFVREAVVVDYIDGDIAVLSSGPSVGTVVAAVGVAELYGTEFEVGH